MSSRLQLTPSPGAVVAGLVAVLAIGALGCGKGPSGLPAPAGPIRLIDQLAGATIDTPPGLDGGRTGGPPPAERRVWRSTPSEAAGYWARGCAVRDGAFRCAGAGKGFRMIFRVPVTPLTAHRLAVRMRVSEPGCVLARAGDGERRRVLSLAGATGWQEVQLIWLAGRRSGEMNVSLLRSPAAGDCELAVESVELFELDLGPPQELALLAAELPPFGDASRGVAKLGVLLPLADAESVAPPFDDNFSAREALFAPAPTSLAFPLRVPRRSRLELSYALARGSRLGDRVDFEIAARSAGGERLLWSERLELSEESWHWHDAVVPLEELGGREVELVLRTRAPDGRGYALWGTPTIFPPRQGRRPPNVVLIGVDTLRADRLALYDDDGVSSPGLAALAADGVRFQTAISQSNWTLASFASIFTGRIVPRHRATEVTDRLTAELPTLAGELRSAGWRTHAVLYKPALFERLQAGFEVSFNVPRVEQRADDNLRQAAAWLRRSVDKRFFLFVHFDDPHLPYTQPPEFVGAAAAAELARQGLALPLDNRRLARHERGLDDENRTRFRALVNELYDQEIRYLDDRLGLLFDLLGELGLYDDAVVAVVSDHGETLWSHYDYHGHGGVNQHDDLVRVPLIVKPPADRGYRRGEVVTAQVRAFDVMPTLLELAGLAPPAAELDARSLVPFLRTAPAAGTDLADRPAFVMSGSAAALRLPRWKYIYPVGSGSFTHLGQSMRLPAEQLYDLRRDPAERTDLASARPETLAAMRRRTMEYLIESVGGRFLVVVGDGSADEHRLEVRCRPACRWDELVHLGLARAASGDAGSIAFAGRWEQPEVLLLARFAAAGGAGMTVEHVGSRRGAGEVFRDQAAQPETLPYETGLLRRLAREGRRRVVVVEAPERAAWSGPRAAAEMDAQQEEALRALGYID